MGLEETIKDAATIVGVAAGMGITTVAVSSWIFVGEPQLSGFAHHHDEVTGRRILSFKEFRDLYRDSHEPSPPFGLRLNYPAYVAGRLLYLWVTRRYDSDIPKNPSSPEKPV